MNALVSYNFDEEAVRVVMIAGDPWFVANDIARVLGLTNSRKAVADLDEDERGVTTSYTLGGRQELNVVSESGMYTLIFKSRKVEARRFRKWVTAEVLPSLRRTGKYQLHDIEPPPPIATDYDPPRLIASVTVVREARRLFGPRAARNVWVQLGLPECVADAVAEHDGDPFAEPIKLFLEDLAETTTKDVARGIGIDRELDWQTSRRINELLRMMGWYQKKVKRHHRTVGVWLRTANRGDLS